MSASLPTIDRRPIPTVAIVGNDAVLVAAPATPVQLSHACLRRGFSVAVPASWGDELVAAEALRQLALRERGPAVMCVCPYARSRLLSPGPDLAPFLVSLVSPPVATARYLRTLYGEQPVHITYIGGCPGADDPAIDVRLTPDAFLADLAERGISLSEQPLVFDSIVPPDRRRWCSLPGGVPNAEILWNEADTRTLIEIDRDDVSTDLAQHIITREHVLIDLAPSLGCACSGVIGMLSPRSARVAVTALEPPRALGPVLDPAVDVTLDAPLADSAVPRDGRNASVATDSVAHALLESRLDEMLGIEVNHSRANRELEAELDADIADDIGSHRPAHEPLTLERVASTATVFQAADLAVPAAPSAAESLPDVDLGNVGPDDLQISGTPGEPPTSSVRRRTPPAVPMRFPSGAIPKSTGSGGRPLPRAYVAKRRTPSAGMPTIAPSLHPTEGDAQHGHLASAPPLSTKVDPHGTSHGRLTDSPPNLAPAPSAAPPQTTATPCSTPATVIASVANGATAPVEPTGALGAPQPAGAVATPSSNQSALAILLIAVLLTYGLRE